MLGVDEKMSGVAVVWLWGAGVAVVGVERGVGARFK